MLHCMTVTSDLAITSCYLDEHDVLVRVGWLLIPSCSALAALKDLAFHSFYGHDEIRPSLRNRPYLIKL